MRFPHSTPVFLAFGIVLVVTSPAPAARPVSTGARPLPAEPAATKNWSTRDALDRLSTPVAVRFHGQTLADVVRYLSHTAGIPIEAFWTEDGRPAEQIGLDPMTPITLDARGLTCLEALEAVLARAAESQRLDQTVTWQFAYTSNPADGARRVRTIEIGPADRLNHPTAIRAEVYDVADLLAAMAPPEEPARVETIRLTLAPGAPSLAFPVRRVQTSPPPTDLGPADGLTPSERELVDVVTTLIEPAQWVRNGGDAARIGVDTGALVVVAPDYIHRQIAGLSSPG